jgi:hypothetical protein
MPGRRLRAAFSFVEVLEVRELEDAQPPAKQPPLLDEEDQDGGAVKT